MEDEGKRVLSIAVRNNRVGYVLLIDGEPVQWAKSKKACQGAKLAARFLKSWIDCMLPNLIVIENPRGSQRKGRKSKTVIRSLMATTERRCIELLPVSRPYLYRNLFEEGHAYIERYPIMDVVQPRERKTWTSEDPNYVYFEALVLAQEARVLRDVGP